jgi:hypothetical protein
MVTQRQLRRQPFESWPLLAFARDGRLIATVRTPDRVEIWDVQAEERWTVRAPGGSELNVAANDDGTRIAVASGGDIQTFYWPDDLPREPAALAAWIDARLGPAGDD